MIGRLNEENIAIIKDYAKPAEWVKNTQTALKGLDKYIKDKTSDVVNDEGWNHSMNPRIKRCLKQLDEEKQKAVQTLTETPWRKVCFRIHSLFLSSIFFSKSFKLSRYACSTGVKVFN